MKPITQFKDKYYFLSNFFPRLIKDDDFTFQCVESAFQSLKCKEKEDRSAFQMLPAAEAKKKGRTVKLRPDWEDNKLRYMYLLVLLKFQSHPDLRDQLLSTGDAELIEGNTWHDNYWGNCECPRCQSVEGQNHLGKILMRVRNNLHAEKNEELRVLLPDGTTLVAHANRTAEYPGISISLIYPDGIEDQVCYAEYNKDTPEGKELHVGAFCSWREDPVYHDCFN